jgi:hypothetical protein
VADICVALQVKQFVLKTLFWPFTEVMKNLVL